jgi:Mn-containing catalase
MDIGTEELSHLEIVGSLARMHLKPVKFDREKAEADPLVAIAGGGGVNLFNSQGNPWTADYLKSPASSTSTCAAISQQKHGRRSSTSA